MTVKAVQQNENRSNVFASVLKATAVGGMAGYVSKHTLPLTQEELHDIPYRSILNSARKDTNKATIAKFNALESRTLAQDTFIKMIDEKNFKKSVEIAEDALKVNGADVANEFKGIIKIVNEQSKAVAKNITSSFHKMIKCKRPTAAFVVPGAILGFVSGAVYNAFKNTNID